MFWTVVIFLLNFFISWSNAYGAGRTWVLTRDQGGVPHLLNWCAAIMSACGFSWCYTFILVGGAYEVGWLPTHQAGLALQLGYVIIIPAIIGTGLVITVNSWVVFYKNRSLGNAAVATYNTYAQTRNMIDAVEFFPEALRNLGGSDDKAEKDDDDVSGKIKLLAILIVILALISGILTTRYIILNTASNYS